MAIQGNILEVINLKKHFLLRSGILSRTKPVLRAVDGIDFNVRKAEMFGLVGESGCGKSTVARCILRLTDPTEGEIIFEGRDISKLSQKQFRPMRRDTQIIFQNPFSSLNPRMRVLDIVSEPLTAYGEVKGKQKEDTVASLLVKVGLKPEYMKRFPHEFSGGQRQRIGIARALSLNPKLIIGDEPLSALDVSIQAQIVNLLDDLQQELGFSFIIISHDLAVVEHMCDRVAVMYLGRIVEMGSYKDIYGNAKHPYTSALLSSVPLIDQDSPKSRTIIKGEIPNPISPPEGCRFHPRCPSVMEACKGSSPSMRNVGNGHFVSCLRV